MPISSARKITAFLATLIIALFVTSNSRATTVTLYTTDFEGGLGAAGFTVNGLWHLSTACNATLSGHTTPTALYYGQDSNCTYDDGTRNVGTAAGPLVSLPAGATVFLTMQYFLQTENQCGFDTATIEILDSSGTTLAQSKSCGGVISNGSGAWKYAAWDISAFAGITIRPRFRFDTVDAFTNSFPGFSIDDLTISASGGTTPVTLSEWDLQ